MVRVSVTSIDKQYKHYPTPSGRLLEWATGGRRVAHSSLWALRDISFEVGAGECVGVIGMNGAGKSTLLKILTGTTLPTRGAFVVTGRIAALLELGLGMHPEFTGRQNAILTCLLMGLEPAVIEGSLPWIAAFSELGDRLDHPLRTYSTGMQVRLAFSAATAVRPDVLIVDEALSVGDAYFQHKSMSRIRAFKEQGMTLLFVTHDPAALKAVCDRAILLDAGHLVRDGAADAVFDYYNALVAQKTRAEDIIQTVNDAGGVVTRSGTKAAEIVSLELRDAAGQPRQLFQVGETASIHYRIKINRHMPTPTVGFIIRDRLGSDVFGTNTYHLGVDQQECAAGAYLAAAFEVALNLGCGHYSLSAALHTGAVHLEENFDWWDQALTFQVVPNGAAPFVGVAALPTRASIRIAREGAG